jgi:hypothetical protein
MPLSDRRADALSLAGGAAAGAIAFHFCIGFTVLDPFALGWLFAGGHDPSANFIGWHMLRSSPWEWPPGAVPALGHPVGTSVALTDSIPAVAVILKMFHGLLPPIFQYFGLWLLSCFVLQGVFGALLVGMATRSVAQRVLGATLFVLAPVVAHRLGHMALCAHWLLLAALWLHRRHALAAPARALHFASWVVLVTMAAGTHPYLTVMVLAVAAATSVVWLGPGPWAAVLPAAAIGVLVSVAGIVWWLGGYFIVPDSGALSVAGFGVLSMNALAPLIPDPGALTFGRVPWSTAHHEQHEGFSYMGLGVLLVLGVAAVLLLRRRPRVPSAANLALGLACAGLTLFALSPVVTVGSATMLHYPSSWWGPLSTFRASGRMFWPVLYALTFAGVGVVVRRLPAVAATGVLIVAVGLQAADLRGVYQLSLARFTLSVASPLTSPFWHVAPRHYRHIVLHPASMCAPFDTSSPDYRFFAIHAGLAGATINSGFAARYDAEGLRRYCEGLAADLQAGIVADDALYVVAAGLESIFGSARSTMTCLRADGYGVCFTARSHANWAADFAETKAGPQ